MAKCACSPSKHLAVDGSKYGLGCQGPGLRKGPHWYDKPFRATPELWVAPDKATRWQQVLKAVGKEYEKWQEASSARPLDDWTRQLKLALDVDFSERS